LQPLPEPREGVAKRYVRVEPGDIVTLGLGDDAPHAGGQCTTALVRAGVRTQDTTTTR